MSRSAAKEAYEGTVIEAVLRHSVSKNYNEAKREWEYRGEVIDYGPLKDQKIPAECHACGHPIRYGYILHNRKNNKRMQVGSECVGNFLAIHVRPSKLKQDAERCKARKYHDAHQEIWNQYLKVNKGMEDYFKKKFGLVSISGFLGNVQRGEIGGEKVIRRYEEINQYRKLLDLSTRNEAMMLKNLPQLVKMSRKFDVRLSAKALKLLDEVAPMIRKKWGMKK